MKYFGACVLSLSLVAIGCSSSETKPQTPEPTNQTAPKNETPVDISQAPQNKKNTVTIDPEAVEKAKPLFETIVKNDEKKAKLAYGRAVRHLPEIVQLAVDLRLKNYEHASTVLPKTSLSDAQKDFWQKVISKKPAKLAPTICKDLSAAPNFPAPGDKAPDEEVAWQKYFEQVAQTLINPGGAPKEKSDLNKSLEKVPCTDKECGPLSDNLRAELLNDKFFDELHNMRRRDTRFYQSSYLSPLKLGQYKPYVYDMGILKLYRATKTTPFDKQNHFLRRFKSIARDMRTDTILSRSIADIILGDDQDLALARRLGLFLTSNPMISSVTRIEGVLANCEVPHTANPSASPTPSSN